MKLLVKTIVIASLFSITSPYKYRSDHIHSTFTKYDFIRMIGGFLNGYGATDISEVLVNINPSTGRFCGHDEINAVEESFKHIYIADMNTPCYLTPNHSFTR